MQTKEELKKHKHQYYIDNKKHIDKHNKKYRDDNKEKCSKQRKQYKNDNREIIKKQNKQYLIDNKEMVKQKRKQSYVDNKKEIKKYNEEYYNTHPEKYNKEKSQRNNFKRHYKITLEQYNELFNKQNGCCMICGKHQSELKRALNVDHDHITGKVRGLLCDKCNNGMGRFNDNIILLQNAINYLKDNS